MTIPTKRVSQISCVIPISSPASAESNSPLPSVASAPRWSLYSARQRWIFLAILFLVTTSNYFDYYIVSVVLEPVKKEFHVSDTMLGLLTGFAFALFYAAAALPIARWADRGNRRTVITLSLVGWSVMTAVCGLAQSFWQLLLARFGVGAVEPGAVPPSQSLIADYFPPERLATASSILNAGSAAGYLLAVVVGGYIVATHGWRTAFLLAGVPGLALALMVRFTLAEPRCRLGYPAAGPEMESVGQAFSRLRRKRSFVYALVGITVYTIFAFGVGIFLPSFMIRTFDATLTQVSLTWGFAMSTASLIGAPVGGWLADQLGTGDIRWYAWLPAIACALGAPIYWLALGANHLWTFIAIEFVAELILAIGISVCFAVIHAICGHSRRTTAIAIVQLSFMLIGCGFGPLVAGMLSDAFSSAYGLESLRYSLITMVVFLVPAAAAFYWAGLAMPVDQEK